MKFQGESRAGRDLGFEVATCVEAGACCVGNVEDTELLRGLNFTTCIQCPIGARHGAGF